MTDKIFYKKRLVADEEGLVVRTDRFVSIHETPCFYYCVPERELRMIPILKGRGETILEHAKRTKMLKRIDKKHSRIAFETEAKAMDHLRMLKRRQLRHMERDREFIQAFLDADEFETSRFGDTMVPGSYDLVHDHLRFD